MNKTRLEAFSDGVIAIIITIMVLEFKVPHSGEWHALEPIIPTFLSYVLSFIYVGVYWNNHHHMLHVAKHVNGAIMWCNLNLLFWLSLVPFTTAWMGENHFASVPVVVYAILLLLCGLAYDILRRSIIKGHPHDEEVSRLLNHLSAKTIISIIFDLAALGFAFFYPLVAVALLGAVSLIWFVPDKTIERSAQD